MKSLENWTLVALMFSSLSTYTQNEYFANNPKWGIHESCQLAPLGPWFGEKTTYYVDGDTILNDKVFVKIYQEGIEYQGIDMSYTETPFSNPMPLAFLRSEGMKMFIWNDATEMEELVYDYDVAVGDPFMAPLYTYPNYVAAIDIITIGGIERKVFTVSEGGDAHAMQFIEGVGHWRGLWQSDQNNNISCQDFLTCFSLNDESYIVDIEESPWLIPSSDICEYVVSTAEIDDKNFKVFPNPTSDELNIQFDSLILSIEIVDIAGRIILAIQPNTGTAQVNVNGLPEGLYFLTATAMNGRTEKLKFLKNGKN
jgi:hypothetical protein